MGTACGVARKPEANERQVVMPLRKVVYKHLPTLSEMKKARIGPFFLLDLLMDTPKYSSRLEKWNQMLNVTADDDFPLESFISEDEKQKKVFRRRLVKGPPPQYRWQAWTAVRALSFRISEKDYEDLPRAKGEVEAEIKRDVDRTFPNQPFFSSEGLGAVGQDSLLRLLSKLAGKYPNIGYCQGMNFVAGFMLLVSGGNEVEVFYMLEELLLENRLAGFYSKNLPYLRKCQFVFRRCLQHYNPTLSAHFNLLEVPEDAWVVKWLLTLYCAAFPLPVVLRIWDHYLVHGIKILFKAGLAVLKEFTQQLLQMDIAQVGEFLQAMDGLEISPESFIQKIAKFRLSDKKLRNFELDYKSERIGAVDMDVIREDTMELPAVHSKEPSRKSSFAEVPAQQETINTRLPELMKEETRVFTEISRHEEAESPRSRVPVLPNIYKRKDSFKMLTLDPDASDYEGDDEDMEEPLNARLVLEDLLREKSNVSVLSLNSICNLPGKSTPEIDRFIQFVDRLPM